MSARRGTAAIAAAGLLLVAAGALSWRLGLWPRRGEERRATAVAPPPELPPPVAKSWKAAAARVEEPRGEPTGRQAKVAVPPELRHYSDPRRFLAVQVAETERQDYDLPPDWAALAKMIRSGEVVEMPAVGDDYILYGVGARLSGEPLVHYDPKQRVEVPLYGGWDEWADADAQAAAQADGITQRIAAAQADLKKTAARDRRRRRALAAEIRSLRTSLARLNAQRKLAAAYYNDYDRRRALVQEYREMEELARNFNGRSYDLRRAEDRRRFEARMLAYIRPEGRDVLLEVAHAYKEQFGRPLPVTSLVRTEAYQRELGETNPNATRISMPPHATGLAFDVYTRFMTAAEQQFLMAKVARMEDEGRVEALREGNRDHIHIFAFAGQRPSEAQIARSLREIGPSKGAVVASASSHHAPVRVAARSGSRPARGGGAVRALRTTGRAPSRRAGR